MANGSAESEITSERTGPETFGRYTLLEKIGQGGMAEVFRAKSYGVEGFEKVLVIKRILPQLAREPKFVDLFVREAKLSVRLSHANVVQVFDLGRVGGALFIAMEYVQGLDLATLLAWNRRRNVPVAVSVAGYVAAEVAKGLDHAHRRRDEQMRPLGIVHRDVSPQNVLLSYEGEVKVTDFGIAKARDIMGDGDGADGDDEGVRSDGRISIRGKYAYLAPEQASGGATDARCDIFSLGIVMYEMLAGSNPFAAPTMFETLRRVRLAEHPPLELARPDVPKELAAIVARALAQKPEDRYPDAARLHDDLLAFLYSSGERFGAHTLSDLLLDYRERERAAPSVALPAADLALDEDVEAGLVRTPVEVPDPSDVATAPPRPTTAASLSAEGGGGGLARAVALGQHREVTALVLDVSRARGLSGLGATNKTSDSDRFERSQALGAIDTGNALLRRYGAQIVEADATRLEAIFGLDPADGRDTDLAVRAALVVGRALREVAPDASIGLHAGKVSVDGDGKLVRDDRCSALFSGARELSHAREGRVAISTAALRHVQASVDYEPIPDAARVLASVNGVLLRGRKAAADQWAKFVGRREELRVLGEILASATRRRARLVTVRGAAGSGKTRLLHEVHRRLQRGAYNVGWYLASCSPHGADLPLSGVAAMLRVLCGIEEGDDQAKLDAVRPRLRALGLGDDDQRTVIDLVREGGDAAKGQSTGAQEHAAAALGHMVARLCDDRLQVLAWDDIQSIDPASVTVLSSLARAVAGARVVLLFAGLGGEADEAAPGRSNGVLVQPDAPHPPSEELGAASRPSGRPPSSRTATHHLIVLEDLTEDDTRKMLASRLGVREVAPELVTFVAQRAAGNPLFIEELLRAMQDAGAIAKQKEEMEGRDGARVTIERAIPRRLGEAIDLPKSLRGLVSSRVAKLPALERGVLTAIALIGEPTEIELLAASVSDPILKEQLGGVAGLERLITPLEASGLLRREGERNVAFVSPIGREVVLDAAPAEAKRELHAAIAAALIALPNPPNDRVGHHLLEGGDRDRAASYFGLSGAAHLAAGRPEAAARDLTRAFTASDLRHRDKQQIRAWLQALVTALGTARGGRVQGAADAATAIDRALACLAGEPALKLPALVDAGRGFASVSQFDRARAAFDEAEALAQKEGAEKQGEGSAALRSVLMARADMLRRTGEFGEVVKLLGRIETGEQSPSREQYDVLISLSQATAAIGGEGATERALAQLEKAADVAARIGDTVLLEAERAKARVLIHCFCRDWAEGARCAQKAADRAREVGLLYETAINLHNLGDCLLHMADHAAAYAALQQSLVLAEEGGHDRLVAINRGPILYLDAIGGDATALHRLREINQWNHQRGYAWDEMNTRYLLGLVHVARKEEPAARLELEAARALAVQLQMTGIVLDCDEAFAKLAK